MRFFLTVFIILHLTSCENDNRIIISDNTKTHTKFPTENKVEFKKLVEYKFGDIGNLLIVDSTLIIKNSDHHGSKDYNLWNYSLSKSKFSSPYIRRGKDKGEILGMANMGIHKNYLWLNDFTAKKMMVLDKNNVISGSLDSYTEFSFNDNRYYRSLLIDKLQSICTGSEKSKYKIQIIDLSTGKKSDEFGELKNHPKDVPLHVIAQATLTQTFYNQTKNKIALAYFYTDIVEIFDINTKKSISIQGPEVFDTNFKVYKNTWFENDKTRVAFIDGVATNNYIYLLYSGKYFNEQNAFLGNSIYVYDWKLNPIRKINLNIDVVSIAISDDNRFLYSFDKNTNNIVYAGIK